MSLFAKSVLLMCFLCCSFLVNINRLHAQEEEKPVFSIVCDDLQQQAVLYEEEQKNIVFYLSRDKAYDEKSMFEITNLSKSDIKNQNRSFGIYKENTWMLDIPPIKKNKVFCLKTIDLIKLLGPGTFILNTMAIPSDPELAKLVKPARVPVCTLIIE